MCIAQTAVCCDRASFNYPPYKEIDFSTEPAAYVRDDRYRLLREYVENIANKLFQINKGLHAETVNLVRDGE